MKTLGECVQLLEGFIKKKYNNNNKGSHCNSYLYIVSITTKIMVNQQQTNINLNSSENYILVTPNKEELDKLSQSILFGVHSKTSNISFKNYIRDNDVHHILVTYKCLSKLIKWLKKERINAYNYTVLYLKAKG